MKILMVLDKEFPTDLRVENEATSLLTAGHEVSLLSISTYKATKVANYKKIKIYKNAVSLFQSKKMHGLAAMIPWVDRYVAKKVLQILKYENYDAIHFHDLFLFGAARLIKKKHDVFMVGDMHENYVEVIKDYKWATKFPNRLLISRSKWLRKEKEWLADMDKVITVSKGIRQRIIDNGVPKEDTVLLPNTIHTGIFDAYEVDENITKRFSDYFTLVYVGGFISNRGLEHVVEGMKALRQKIDNIHLLLVGDGAMKKTLKQIAEENDVDDIISFEGWQNQNKIKAYLKASDVGLVPFKRTPQTDNSSSNKLFQYMYYELPILATNCTSVKKLVEKEGCGLIYESENVEQFIESVRYLYINKDISKKMGETGKKAVIEKYNWEVTAGKLVEMYDKLGEKSR